MYVYKIQENVNGFYSYFVSHTPNVDLASEYIEHTSAYEPDDILNYFNAIGWDNIAISKENNIKAVDVLNKAFQNDSKNMLISEEYKKFTPQPKEKKKREVKPKEPKEPKPKRQPKQKAGKTAVKIEINNDEIIDINNP